MSPENPAPHAPLQPPALAPARRHGQRPGRRRQWSRERVLQAVHDWYDEVGVPPYSYEWDPEGARKIGRKHAAGVKKWVREYPRWPSSRTATGLYGSWRGLLTEAGMPSAPPLLMGLQERLDTAERLRDRPAQDVADLIGVTAATVRTYWRAPRCPGCGRPKVTPHAARCGVCAKRPVSQETLSRTVVLAAIRAWARETGAPPHAKEWMLPGGKWEAEYPRWPALHQVKQNFGSWNAAITAAGLDARQRRWSPPEVLDAARDWAHTHGRPPRLDEWRHVASDGSHPSTTPVLNAFGTWNAMLQAAGLAVTHRTWTRRQILDALRGWIATHGHAPTMNDWRRAEPPNLFPTTACVADHFGSWNAMLAAADVAPNRRYWTREQILDAAADFQHRHGRTIRASDLHSDNGLPSGGAVRRHIGNHHDLLDALRRHTDQ